MKMHDPQNVAQKAKHMMKSHLELFKEYFGDYESRDQSHTFGEEDEKILTVSFANSSKLVTKIFATSIKFKLYGIEMEKNWEAKINFVGGWKIEDFTFKCISKEGKNLVEELNRHEQLRRDLLSCFKKIDIQRMTVEYKKQDSTVTVIITPYAGTFIWVKLPPVYYDVKLKREEVESIYQITLLLENYFGKGRIACGSSLLRQQSLMT